MDVCSWVMSVPAHPIQGPRHMDLLSFLLHTQVPSSGKALISSGCHVLRLLRLASLCLLGASESLEANIPVGTFPAYPCYVCSCLLPQGTYQLEVAQSPSHRVIEKKQAVNLSCDPISGHNSLFWYYHAVGTEMKLLVYFLRESVQDNSGMPKGRFTAERTEGTSSILRVHSAELGDSGFISVPAAETQCFRVLSLCCAKPHSIRSSQVRQP